MKPEISVIVPVYNVEPYLRRCLDSIVGQTMKEIEIILIDDGSTDNSGKICDEYSEKDSRIRVIHQKNGGLSNARNTANPHIYKEAIEKAKEETENVLENLEDMEKYLLKK